MCCVAQKEALLAKSAKSLDSLLSLERLRTLTGHDESMLCAMLAMTLKSNSTDLNEAAALYSRADWGELAKSVHRISGAAQITGAHRAENACRQLETACLKSPPEVSQLVNLWSETLNAVEEINASIAAYLEQHSAE